MRVAGGILRHGDETRHAAAALIFRAHCMAGTLRRHHQHVKVLARLDEIEMDRNGHARTAAPRLP